jgi:hypothetical protein
MTMDIAAHMLWVGAATAIAARRIPIDRRQAVAAIALAGLPDVLQLLPVAASALTGHTPWSALVELAIAVPGQEPALPASVAVASHHLHCIAHSAVVAGALTLALGIVMRCLWLPLLGWWSHILIDVFTHSAEFYPSPALYPITYQGFDGIAWNEPWFMALNYMALAAILVGVAVRRWQLGRREKRD